VLGLCLNRGSLAQQPPLSFPQLATLLYLPIFPLLPEADTGG
jgi:hypothetical protein